MADFSVLQSESPHQRASVLTGHSFNWDRSMVAYCPNSEEVEIFGNCHDGDSSKWEKAYTLSEAGGGHTMRVSGIDWSPVTNKIVTCSHDRNAFVWTYDDETNTWKPSLVILRINRAALTVKWSPDGKKFAVGSGAKCVPVCHYEEANDWWISKMIKKHKSTVVALDWHPNNQIIATGCCDFKCRIFSAFVKDVDSATDAQLFGDLTDSFGDELAVFDQSNGWVEAVSWSPSGMRLAFAGHDSTLSVVSFPDLEGAPSVQPTKTQYLPYTAVMFTDDDTVVAAGYDCNPTVYKFDATGFMAEVKKMDKVPGEKNDEAEEKKAKETNFDKARNLFGNRRGGGSRGAGGGKKEEAAVTKHHGCITQLSAYSPGGEAITQISSSGIDGKLSFWSMDGI